MKHIMVCLFVCTVCFNHTLFAQGCSDAGVCMLGKLKQDALTDTAYKHALTVGFSNGVGDNGVWVLTPSVQYQYQANQHWQWQAKVTGGYATGNLGTALGLGDVYVVGNYSLSSTSKWRTSFFAGAKLPLNGSTLQTQNKYLPMQYQSSLGTYDALAGITLQNKKWQLSAAWQQPLSGYNNNQFLPAYWSNHADAVKYAPSNDFNRKADLLLKANYLLKELHKAKYHVGLLAIYHAGHDTYIDGNISNKPLPILGSEGLTFNITTAAQYRLSKKVYCNLFAGIPLIVRTVRPDGLTRSFVISTEFTYQF